MPEVPAPTVSKRDETIPIREEKVPYGNGFALIKVIAYDDGKSLGMVTLKAGFFAECFTADQAIEEVKKFLDNNQLAFVPKVA